MKTKIEIPEGCVIDIVDKVSGEVTFKKVQPLSVTERIKTLADALSELGEDDDEAVRLKKLITLFNDPTDHLVNYQTAVVLVRAINEKREPDWDNENEWKYVNWFVMGGSSGFRCLDYAYRTSYSAVGSRLCFFNPEHGKYLVNQFPDVFKNFMLIIKK